MLVKRLWLKEGNILHKFCTFEWIWIWMDIKLPFSQNIQDIIFLPDRKVWFGQVSYSDTVS